MKYIISSCCFDELKKSCVYTCQLTTVSRWYKSWKLFPLIMIFYTTLFFPPYVFYILRHLHFRESNSAVILKQCDLNQLPEFSCAWMKSVNLLFIQTILSVTFTYRIIWLVCSWSKTLKTYSNNSEKYLAFLIWKVLSAWNLFSSKPVVILDFIRQVVHRTSALLWNHLHKCCAVSSN